MEFMWNVEMFSQFLMFQTILKARPASFSFLTLVGVATVMISPISLAQVSHRMTQLGFKPEDNFKS